MISSTTHMSFLEQLGLAVIVVFLLFGAMHGYLSDARLNKLEKRVAVLEGKS